MIMPEIFPELSEYVHERRNALKRCPTCNGNIEDRVITLYRGLIESLYRIYVWCGEKGRFEFKMSEVKHLMGHVEYSRFNDLVRMGGVVYRQKDDEGNKLKGAYGINMGRCRAFFKGEYSIPVQIVRDQIKNKTIAGTYVAVWDIPDLSRLLSKEGVYDHEKMVHVKPDYETQKKRNIPTVDEYVENKRLF